MMLGFLAVMVGVVATGWRPDSDWSGRMIAMVGAIFGAQSWRRWRLGLPTRRGRTRFALIALVTGTTLAALSSSRGSLEGAAWALGGALVVGIFGETVSRLLIRYRLPSGRRLPVVATELMALRIRWTVDPATVTVIRPMARCSTPPTPAMCSPTSSNGSPASPTTPSTRPAPW